MATQLAQTHAFSPPAFLVRDPVRRHGSFAAALEAAVRAERMAGLQTACQRVARLLCELGKSLGCESRLPVARAALASALGIGLVRIKRTLGLLSLSGVIEVNADSIEVLDWRKLCGAAHVDPAALNLSANEDEWPSLVEISDDRHRLTASGDPACFV
jgi:hypothetical protein